ncbi:MAG: hypothetical protein U1F43_11505 [Myxococcota bacterium]
MKPDFERMTVCGPERYAIRGAAALVVRQMAALRPSGELLLPALVPWLLLALSAGIIVLVARAAAGRAASPALLMVVPLGNTAFVDCRWWPRSPRPTALPFAIIYDQLGSFLALTVYGALVVASWSGGERPSGGALLRRIVLFPPFIALVRRAGGRALRGGDLADRRPRPAAPARLGATLDRIAAEPGADGAGGGRARLALRFTARAAGAVRAGADAQALALMPLVA